MPLKPCCEQEASRSLLKHRDIAACDQCGYLLLAYGDEQTYQLTVQELESKEAEFDTDRRDALWVVGKQR